MRHEQKTYDLFLPPKSEKATPSGARPIERATCFDENVRLHIRSLIAGGNSSPGQKSKAVYQIDWSVDDIQRAIEFLTFILAAKQQAAERTGPHAPQS